MKNFARENWFKLGIITIVVISAVYYFLILVPKRQEFISKKNLLESQIKCQKAGQEYYSKNIDESTPYDAIYKKPQYAFSDVLNTCLYRKEYSIFFGRLGGLAVDDYSIIDVYSNREVFAWYRHYNLAGEVNNVQGNEEAYKDAVNRYFGEK